VAARSLGRSSTGVAIADGSLVAVKILLLGSGGREHALALALAADPTVEALFIGPGNPGTADVGTNHTVDPSDPEAVAALARDLSVDLVVIGPEAPLVAGVADAVRNLGIDCFGPSARAARLEGSKAFAKEVMAEADVPTALAHVCTSVEEAGAALDQFGAPYVVKDDGLAAGKGVVVTDDREEALAHAEACVSRDEGAVVIEEYLDGPEVSLFAITDGTTAVPLVPAQDFKRVGDGDAGPNTGGMGAYAPLPWAPEGLVDEVMTRVVQPTVDAMRDRGDRFVGLLYAGLALTRRGLRVVEFNARFGDPETQVVLALLRTPLAGVLHAAARGTLDELPPLQWHPGAAVTVVLAAPGYPQSPETGGEITGVPDGEGAESGWDAAWVVHAGTARTEQGALVASGGRVLCATARAADLAGARERAYELLEGIGLAGGHYRHDIARSAAEGTVATPATSAG
jgi:phosphoribosylamine---glycine ligase